MGDAKFVGVDWAKGGWFSIAYDAAGEWEANHGAFAEIVERYSEAELILVDIPIGLAKGEYEWRKCDLEARQCLGSHWQSVFLTPPRYVVEEARRAKESNLKGREFQNVLTRINNLRREGTRFSAQAWNITPMIAEVDEFISSRSLNALPKIREVHPEILFWALNGKNNMCCSKKTLKGVYDRMNVLRKIEKRTDAILEHVLPLTCDPKIVGGDDILDALAAAVTARLGTLAGRLQTLPENPLPDDCGEMVFYNPHDA